MIICFCALLILILFVPFFTWIRVVNTEELFAVMRLKSSVIKKLTTDHSVQNLLSFAENSKQGPPGFRSFLLLHGTGDSLVPCEQMERMADSLTRVGARVRAFYVDGAEHEGNFWSPEVREVIREELANRLGP